MSLTYQENYQSIPPNFMVLVQLDIIRGIGGLQKMIRLLINLYHKGGIVLHWHLYALDQQAESTLCLEQIE